MPSVKMGEFESIKLEEQLARKKTPHQP